MDPSRVSAVGGGVAALLVLAAGGAPAGGVAFRGPVEGGGAFADAVHVVVGAGLLLLRVAVVLVRVLDEVVHVRREDAQPGRAEFVEGGAPRSDERRVGKGRRGM